MRPRKKCFTYLYNTSNIEERRRELDELCIEVSSDFRENFQDGRVRENHYWHHFFEVLSTIHLSIAICYFDLKNVDKVIEYAIFGCGDNNGYRGTLRPKN